MATREGKHLTFGLFGEKYIICTNCSEKGMKEIGGHKNE